MVYRGRRGPALGAGDTLGTPAGVVVLEFGVAVVGARSLGNYCNPYSASKMSSDASAAQPEPRVLSLLSAATEIVYRLGCGHLLVGRSHGCDDPPLAARHPVTTAPKVDPNAPSAELDAAVRLQVSVAIAQLLVTRHDHFKTSVAC